MWTNDLLNLRISQVQSQKKIIIIFFLTKNIFPLILLLWRRRWRFLDFKDQSRVTSGLFPNELVKWQRMRLAVLPFTKLAEKFDETFSFVMKPFFPVQNCLWIFSLGFSFLNFFFISQFLHLLSWKKTPLFIGEDMEFEFQILGV